MILFVFMVIIFLFLLFVAVLVAYSLLNKKKNKKNKDPRINAISKMFSCLKKEGTIKANISKEVLESVKIIANEKKWEEKIDEESIDNLYTIYKMWQKNTLRITATTGKIGKCSNFTKEPEDLEETIPEEEYRGSWIVLDSDGQMEEYMD